MAVVFEEVALGLRDVLEGWLVPSYAFVSSAVLVRWGRGAVDFCGGHCDTVEIK